MDAFQGRSPHRPLSQPDEIRVVKLLPGPFDDPIVCTLEHIRLGDVGTTTRFEAVSYAWGDPTQTRLITLDSAPYPVTLNLFSALTYLRSSSDETCLWIDSLCINQQDLAERSAQVPRMRDIYASAALVMVYLGDYGDIPISDWHLGFQYAVESARRAVQPLRVIYEPIFYSDEQKFRYERGRNVMYELLGRPWFTRMWVVQEVAVRHFWHDDEKVRLMVGHLGASWFIMYHAFKQNRFIRKNPRKGALAERLSGGSGLHSIAQAWGYKHALTQLAAEEKYVSFAEQLAMLLSRFTFFGATDPRDRIYSLVGLLVGNETIPGHLAPDYSKPVDKVYHEYTAWMLREGTCPDLLGLSSGPQLDRPSWVPDLVGRRGVFHRNLDDTNPARLLDDDRLLDIEALPITTIVATGRRCTIHEERLRSSPGSAAEARRILAEQCRRYLLECESLLEKVTQAHASNPLAEMSSGANSSSTGWARQPVPQRHKDVPGESNSDPPRQRLNRYFADSSAISLMDYHKSPPLPLETLYELLMTRPFAAGFTDEEITIKYGFEESTLPRECVVQPHASYIADEFDGYVFFVCENGDIDFCRSTSIAPQPGDMLCLLRGSTKRYILRSVAETGQWALIGTAYMDAGFSLAWHREGTEENAAQMRRSWAAMWKENKENGNIISLLIR